MPPCFVYEYIFSINSNLNNTLSLSAGAAKALTGHLYTKDIYPTGDNCIGSAASTWRAVYSKSLLLYNNGKETHIKGANLDENITLVTPYQSGNLPSSEIRMYTMSCYNFRDTYGDDSLPCAYGYVTIYGHSRPGSFNGDTYYMAVDYQNNLWAGIQVNDATSVTWQKSPRFSLSGTILTITS